MAKDTTTQFEKDLALIARALDGVNEDEADEGADLSDGEPVVDHGFMNDVVWVGSRSVSLELFRYCMEHLWDIERNHPEMIKVLRESIEVKRSVNKTSGDMEYKITSRALPFERVKIKFGDGDSYRSGSAVDDYVIPDHIRPLLVFAVGADVSPKENSMHMQFDEARDGYVMVDAPDPNKPVKKYEEAPNHIINCYVPNS